MGSDALCRLSPMHRIAPTPDRAITVPARYARALHQAVQAGGFDGERFLGEQGWSARRLQRDEPVPAELFGRLYQRAMRLLDDESLGMVSAGPVMAGTFRMMCLACIRCATLGAVLQRAGEFLDVCGSHGVKPVAQQGQGELRLGFGLTRRASAERPPAGGAGRPAVRARAGTDAELAAELAALLSEAGPLPVRTSLYYWYNLLGWFAGRSLALSRVDFGFERPSHGAEWRALFGAPIRFGAAQSALVMPAHVLQLPNVQSERTLPAFLRKTPYRLVVPMFIAPTLQDRLRALLMRLGGDAPPDAEAMAAQLGMSASTLRRQLAAEGTRWQTLKEEGRRSAAQRYVLDTDLPVNEIARLLGFDEPSTFYRAFRRWTGTTPSRYRERAAADMTGTKGAADAADTAGMAGMAARP